MHSYRIRIVVVQDDISSQMLNEVLTFIVWTGMNAFVDGFDTKFSIHTYTHQYDAN